MSKTTTVVNDCPHYLRNKGYSGSGGTYRRLMGVRYGSSYAVVVDRSPWGAWLGRVTADGVTIYTTKGGGVEVADAAEAECAKAFGPFPV